MKPNLCLAGMLLLFAISCTKSNDEPVAQTPTTPVTVVTTSTAAILTDPVNCPPSLYQANANAFQLSYARMKLIKGMSGQLTNITPSILANNTIHVYLRGSDGKYYHLPATTIANVAYNYTLTSAFPQSSISIKRGAGPEETFETVIVLGANSSYLSAISPQLNFADYGAVKMKLGF
jgi:hypothetical protein